MIMLSIYGIIINKNKDQQLRDFLTLNTESAPLEIASLFQLLDRGFSSL